MSGVRDIFLTTLHCHSKELPRGAYRYFDLIADEAEKSLIRPLPRDNRLAVVHLECAMWNAIDKFRAAIRE